MRQRTVNLNDQSQCWIVGGKRNSHPISDWINDSLFRDLWSRLQIFNCKHQLSNKCEMKPHFMKLQMAYYTSLADTVKQYPETIPWPRDFIHKIRRPLNYSSVELIYYWHLTTWM